MIVVSITFVSIWYFVTHLFLVMWKVCSSHVWGLSCVFFLVIVLTKVIVIGFILSLLPIIGSYRHCAGTASLLSPFSSLISSLYTPPITPHAISPSCTISPTLISFYSSTPFPSNAHPLSPFFAYPSPPLPIY